MNYIEADEKIDKLPFEKISWPKFEKICLDLLTTFEIIEESREYLNPGDAQDGIDIYAWDNKHDHYIALQCKNEKHFGPKKIGAAIKKFRDGKFFTKSKRFILCTRRDLGNKECHEEIERQTIDLRKHKIRLSIWDARTLNRLLKKHPQIVYDAFDFSVVERFNGKELAHSFKNRLKKPAPLKINYEVISNYIERKVTLLHDGVSDWVSPEQRQSLLTLIETKAKSKNYYLLLSEGGNGKSTELAHLAHFLSSKERPSFPIKIELRDFHEQSSINEMITCTCSDWQNIDPNNLVLIFDGLDEMSEHGYTIFIKKMNLFAVENNKSTIIVSSRTNFYNIQKTDGKLRDFTVVSLKKLDREDIDDYVKQRLGTAQFRFFRIIVERDLNELLQLPFYLKELVDLYQKDGEHNFPKTKAQVVESIIIESSNANQVKFSLSQRSKKSDQRRQRKLIEIVAFTMTQLGINRITDDYLYQILPNAEDREELKYSILTQTKEGYQFSHNIIQEYLSAACLQNNSFEEIIQIISYEPDHSKVKNKWFNSFSFLVATISNQDTYARLIDWIIEIEPEVIVNVEPGKLSSEKRFSIFKKIIEKYKSKGIFLPRHYFNVEKLASFTGGNLAVIDYIIDEIQHCGIEEIQLYCLKLLPQFKNYFGKEAAIKNIVITCALTARDTNVQREALENLANLHNYIDISDSYETIAQHCNNLHEHNVRQGMFALISILPHRPQFIDYALASIVAINGQNNHIFTYEDTVIKEILLKSKSYDEIVRVLQFIIKTEHIFNSYGQRIHFDNKFVDSFIGNCIKIHNEQKELFGYFINLFDKLWHRHNYEEYRKSVANFFFETKTEKRAFSHYFQLAVKDHNNIQLIENTVSFANYQSLTVIVDFYKRGTLPDSFIRICRNILNIHKSEHFNAFYELINIESKNAFLYDVIEHINWPEIRENQKKKDQELLLNKKLFSQEIENVFSLANKSDLTLDDFFDYDNPIIREELLTNTITLKFLRDWLRTRKTANFNSIQRWLSENKWQIYQFDEVTDLVEQNSCINTELKEWTIGYLKQHIGNVDFRSAIKDKDDGKGYTFNLFAFRLNIFNHAWDLKWPDDVLLDLLFTDHFGYHGSVSGSSPEKRPSEFVLRKIKNIDLVKKRVLENLRENSLSIRVLESHYRICHELQIREANHFLYRELQGNRFDNHTKTAMVDVYTILGGDEADLLPLFGNCIVFNDWFFYLAKKLVKKFPDIICLRLIDYVLVEKDEKVCKQAFLILLEAGKFEAIKYFCEYIRNHKKSPVDVFIWNTINDTKFEAERSLQLLFEVLIIPYMDTVTEDNNLIYERMDESIITLINRIALQSDHDYYLTREHYTNFLSENIEKWPKAKNVNYAIDYLESQFYKKRQDGVTIVEVAQTNRRLGLV